jgi:hypothetical protein
MPTFGRRILALSLTAALMAAVGSASQVAAQPAPVVAAQPAPQVTPAEASPRLPLHTNQDYLDEARAVRNLPITDVTAMFRVVLGSLPERVKVYPTENYFYFWFHQGGTRYAGNIRLDASDRDQGRVHFAYYQDLQEWASEEQIHYQKLDSSHGVRVEKLEDLVYRISFGDVSVVFALNDLRGVRPPATHILADERYIGPVFDESGIGFFLVFNPALKLFHYVLNDTGVIGDQMIAQPQTDRITIGRRTGFAFYRDHRTERRVLIGVFEGNSRVNNYFDGPFDQLPDNFIEGETLRDAILAVEPALRGRIDRFGASPDGSDRFMIAPYRHYRVIDDLLSFHACATNRTVPARLYGACFIAEESEAVRQAPPPDPGPRRRRSPRSGRGQGR